MNEMILVPVWFLVVIVSVAVVAVSAVVSFVIALTVYLKF